MEFVTDPKRAVLVVDDDPAFRIAVADTLTDEGYSVEQAADGQAALQFLRTQPPPPPLILLDWHMAPMDGSRFVAEVSRNREMSPVPVVLLSADRRVQEPLKAFPFAACIEKPVDLDRLLGVVRRYCDGLGYGEQKA
jgi:CheY-like chemotaxis protein